MSRTIIFVVACTLVLPLVKTLEWRRINDPHALCNDFSRAGYYIHRNHSSSDWLVFLEGGGACYSAETCNRRYLTHAVRAKYGGGVITQDFDLTRAWNENRVNRRSTVSPLMTSINNLTGDEYLDIAGTDILSTNKEINPNFYHYNHILVPYCSSDLWLGNDDITRFGNQTDFEFKPETTDSIQFIFKGFVIFQSVIREVIPTITTSTVLLSGSSAGGIGVLNHAKWVKEYLPNAKVKVFAESSWFVNFHDNIYHLFTDYVNISKDSRLANFNVTEFVMKQDRANGGNITSLYSLMLHHLPCNSNEFGTPCCISAHCLITNSKYYPSDIPTFMAFGLYDVYMLARSLQGIKPFNTQETSFEVNFNNKDETEPVGLNFNFLRIIGEYGGVMNSTLDIASHQSPHLSYYVTSCLQHIYLATSSLWGEGGLFGIDSFEFNNDISSIRHTIKQNRWINFKLTQLSNTSGDIEYGVSLRDAVGIWLNTANSTNPVQFREACYLTHCNEMCPEEIAIEQDESFLWEDEFEVFIYCIVATVTLICFIIKGVFYLWHWRLLHKQNQFLGRARNVETRYTTNQLPECEDKISIACLDLHYSVPFNHKKHISDYDVMPMVLPSITTEDCDNVNKKCMDGNNQCSFTSGGVTFGFDGAKSQFHDQTKSRKSKNGESLNGSIPLMSNHDKELFTVTEVGNIVKNIVEEDQHKKMQPKEKVKVILEGISLYFNPGHLVAIMGPSGSGKTTFLDLLTGHRKYGNISGSIFVNGHSLDDIRDWYIANTGYVLQLAMPYYEELTVRENLTLAAQMRLSFSMREKFKRIEQVMNETGLQEIADTVVGGTVGPGLSGGQKKRLTIALQLLRLPSVIFLDEPTSGLDSASSYELLTYLNKLAGSQRTVIMTIHQPRMEIFHMFNRLIMLCEGKVAYHGTPLKAYEVFTTALKAQYLEKGFVLPLLEDQNPADVIMDMLNNSKMREAILQYYQQSGDPRLVFEAIKQSQEEDNEMIDGNNDIVYTIFGKRRECQKQGSSFTCMAALEARASLRTTVPQLAYLPLIFLSYGFLLGTVYIQTTSAVLIVSGFCVYSVASALFMFPIMHKYYSQALTLYQLEHSDGIGHSVDMVIQGFVRFVFLGLIPVILCGGILYLLVIKVSSYSLEVYLQVLVVNMALNQTWIALLLFVLCAFPSVAFRLSPVISSVAGFASGFFIPRDTMPPWYRWLFFINPNYYGFSSTSYLLLKEFNSNCAGNELECYVSTGDYTLNQFNFNETNPALHVMILLAMTTGYLILAVVAMWIRHADFGPALRRLRAVFCRSDGRLYDFERWSRLKSPATTENDSERGDFDIEMTKIGSEVFSNSDEFLSDIDEDDEFSSEDSKKTSVERQVQEVSIDNNKNNSESSHSVKEQRSNLSLPIVNEMSQKSLSSYNHNENESESNFFEELLNYSAKFQNEQDKNHKSVEKQTSSISLPETDNPSKSKQLSTPMGRFGSTAKPQCKLKRRSTTHGAPQWPKELHHLQHKPCLLSNFLDDDESHVIWKPDTPHETTSSSKKKSSTWAMESGTNPNLFKPFTWGEQHEIAASSATGSPGTPVDLRQKQKQLLERVNIAREVAKDQKSKLIQPEVAQEVKQHALRLSSRYVSFRMSKKRQHKDGVVLQPTGCETNTQNQSSLAGSTKQLSQKQKDMSPVADKAEESMTSPMTSLSSIHSEMLSTNYHTNDQGIHKISQLGEVYKSQSEYTLSSDSKGSPPTKISSLKPCTSYTPINIKQLRDDTSKTERRKSVKKEYSVFETIDSVSNSTSVSKVAPVEYKDCSDDLETATRYESAVTTLSGNTSNNSNNSTSGSSDEVTADFPHINGDTTAESLSRSDLCHNYDASYNLVKSTSHAIPGSSSPMLSSSSPLIANSSFTSPSTSEDNSCTNLIPHMPSEVMSLYAGQKEYENMTTY